MSERLAKSAGTVGLAVMTSRLLGVIRDQVMAGLFGTGMAQDAFNIASRIPNLVRDLFAEGAMSAAFVPTFTRHLQLHGKEAAWRLGNLVLNALIVITAVLVVAGMFLAEPILLLLPEDFAGPDGAQRLSLTVSLARVIMPFLTLVAVAVALGGMLNALRRFFIPALSPAVFNVGVLFSAVAIVPFCDDLGWHPIFGIAVGTLIGGLGQILIQIPLLHREGFRYKPILSFRDPGMREILLLMGPGTLGLAAAQVNLLVNTYLAYGEGEGAVSALSFAFRLMYLPIGLFGVSVATATLPEVARHAATGAIGEMRRTLSSSLRMMLMLSVPATIGLMALSSPIVEFLFERGAFDSASTRATALALLCYAPGLIGYSAVKIASPTFYAMHDARTPVLVSLATIVINVVLNVTLVRVMSFQGLALGTAIAALFNAGMLLFLLSRRTGGLEGSRVLQAFVKILVASIAMGAAALVTEAWLDASLPDMASWVSWMYADWVFAAARTLRAGIRVGGAIGVGLLVLGAMSSLLRLHEFTTVLARVMSRVRR
ncbi:MAG: murein biosynthesis integral membrane protein MurJ [Acidobacteria bacterium]|nr:murein biosynthesis integral membrane protein MurJ [Acidobacteriota bacterium]